LRNFADVKEFTWAVYQHPEYIETLPSSTPIKDHVKVDLELWGCPVNKYQVVEVVTALLMNRRPLLPTHSVCLDCKRLGYTCVPVAAGIPCMGPLTRSGCGALCPGKERGCYGCFGPVQNGEIEAWIPVLKRMERHPNETLQLLRNFCANAPAFRDAAEALLADGEV
jgi:coenzyme F420-reducing hydrogenase gamma subunit